MLEIYDKNVAISNLQDSSNLRLINCKLKITLSLNQINLGVLYF